MRKHAKPQFETSDVESRVCSRQGSRAFRVLWRSSGTNMIKFLPDFGLTKETIDPFGNCQFLSVAQQ